MKTPTRLVLAGIVCSVAIFSTQGWSEELSKTGPTAFRLHRDGMNSAQVADFNYGRGLFHHFWEPIEYGDKTTSGFGPLYNADACVGCHISDGRGHPPVEGSSDATSFVLRLSTGSVEVDGYKTVLADPVYGFQFQDKAILDLAPEGNIAVSYEETELVLADGEVFLLRSPSYQLENLGYGPPSDDIAFGPRIAPQLIGLGLLEAVPVERLLELEDIDDKDGDGISGKINWSLPDGSGNRLPGRFGWKLTATSVREQSDMAANADMGLSTPLANHLAGDCTVAQSACTNSARDVHFGKLIELDEGEMRLLAFYTANLRVPDPRNVGETDVGMGRQIFAEAGCASCHVPEHQLENGDVIAPYTDLLLHDLGVGLADGIEVGVASYSEWRTAPLWGIGMTKIVSGHTFFLHDGRARNLSEAILWHGGEAEASRIAFEQMSTQARASLLAFVNSL